MDETRFDAWSAGLTGGALASLLTYSTGDRPLTAAAAGLLLLAGTCLGIGLLFGIASLQPRQFAARSLAWLRCQSTGTGPLRLIALPTGPAPYAEVGGGPVGQRCTGIADSGDVAPSAVPGTVVAAAPALLFAFGVLAGAIGVLIQSLA